MAIPKKVKERLRETMRQFRPVLEAQQARDISEADTVTLVKDLLSDMFGYDKYTELTGEHAIRGRYCDIAVQIDGRVRLLIEVKAIGIDLNDRHFRQAVDYAANEGIEWIALTNAVEWRVHHVIFGKPIDTQEVLQLNLLGCDPRKDEDLEVLHALTRHGLLRDALPEFRDRRIATSPVMLAAILLESDSVLAAIRRELRRASDLLVDSNEILRVLKESVIKRQLLEGDDAQEARKRYARKERQRRPRRGNNADASAKPNKQVKAADAQETQEKEGLPPMV